MKFFKSKILSQNFFSSSYFYIFLLIFISLIGLKPLFSEGFFVTDDGDWLIIRFTAFYENFRTGQFPVRFLTRLNDGYGYPVANFNYPGFMYIASIFKVLGFSFVDSIKILIGIFYILSGVFIFLFLSKFFKKPHSFIASISYIYSSYFLYDIYTRGSIGEIMALCVAPFVLWQIERRSVFFISVGIGLLLLSHNILSLIFIIFIFLYIGVSIVENKKNKFNLIISILFGFGLSAFFWIPAIYELRYTVFRTTQISDFANYFVETSMILVPVLVTITPILIWIFNRKKLKIDTKFYLFFISNLFLIFMVLPLSEFMWEILPTEFIQFPFRLMSLIILVSSFLFAWSIEKLPRYKYVYALIIVFLISIQTLNHLSPEIVFREEGFYSTNNSTTTIKNEYMPTWVKNLPVNKNQLISSENLTAENLTNLTNTVLFNTSSNTRGSIIFNKIYYPGWNVYIDNKIVDTRINENGLMQFEVPEGRHNVLIKFEETYLRMISNAISIISFICLIFISFYYKREQHENN